MTQPAASIDPVLVQQGVPENDAAIELVETQIGLLFNRVRATWKDSAASVHPKLQPVGYKLLSTLVREGPTHSGALAELILTDKSVISRQVRLLEELEFVVSDPDPSDRRARLISATPAAIERVNAVRAKNQVQLYDFLGTWTQDELTTFAALLGRLSEIPRTTLRHSAAEDAATS